MAFFETGDKVQVAPDVEKQPITVVQYMFTSRTSTITPEQQPGIDQANRLNKAVDIALAHMHKANELKAIGHSAEARAEMQRAKIELHKVI